MEQRISKIPAFLLMTKKIPQMAQNKAENDDWSSPTQTKLLSSFQTITNSRLPYIETNLRINQKIISL